MAGYKYDIVTLIELVESKPCIWDKTNEHYKNKVIRDRSWQEVFQDLDDGYEVLCQAEQKKIGEVIMSKWSNIRDAFLRTLRTKGGQRPKRRYIYSEHLQFLLKKAQKDDTESNFSQSGIEDDSTEVEEFAESQMQPAPSTSRSTSSEHMPQSKRKLDDIEHEILLSIKKEKQPVEPIHHSQSDQEILLLSFLPYIRDMSETELMDLQMEVLTTIKKIKQRRISY